MKRTITLFTAFFLVSIYSIAQDTWTQKAHLPGVGRKNAIGFSIGNKGYCGLGDSLNCLNDWWEWDPSTDAWTQKAGYPAGGRIGPSGFSIGDKGYVGAGSDCINFTNDFYEYDPAANTWTAKAHTPGVGRAYAVAFSIGDKGYFGTGFNTNGFYNDWWEYDPSLDSWTSKATFGGGARFLAVGFSIGNLGYISSGSFPSTYYNDMWEYDPALDTWTAKADYPADGRQAAAGFAINGRGYVSKGWTGTTYAFDLWEWDQLTDTWTARTTCYNYGLENLVGFSIGNKGYMGMGQVGIDNAGDFWEYSNCIAAPSQPDSVSGPELICTGDSAIFTVPLDADATSYSWTLPVGLTGSSDSNSIHVIADVTLGIDTISVTANNYCGTSVTQTFSVSASPCTGIEEDDDILIFRVYPNPANRVFTIYSSVKSAQIEIQNVLGEEIFTSTVNNQQLIIDLSKRPAGIYFVQITDERKNVATKKIILQ